MIDKLVDKIMNVFNKNKSKGSNPNDDSFNIENEINYQSNNQQSNMQYQGQNSVNYNYQANSTTNLRKSMEYKQGMKKNNYSDPGFTDYPYAYIKSKWFIPTIIILILLIIVALYIRIFVMPTGDLKGADISIPDIIYVGEKNNITALATGSGNLNHTNFYFTSSDDAIAEPNAKSGITGKKIETSMISKRAGTITVSGYGKLGNINTITTTKEVTSCYKLSKERVSLDTIIMQYGRNYTVNIDLGISSKCYDNIKYSTSDRSIATVEDGIIHGEGVGDANLIISQNNIKIEVPIKVLYSYKDPSGVTLDQTTIDIEKNRTDKITYVILPDEAPQKDVTFTSSDENVAIVNNRGVVTGISYGTATITATTLNGYSSTCTVNIVKNKIIPVRGITLDRSSLTINQNSATTLYATINPYDATNQNIIWTSSDPDIAYVSNKGVVTGYEKGTVTITATTEDGDFTSTATITVE